MSQVRNTIEAQRLEIQRLQAELAEARKVNYEPLLHFAQDNRISYNELCAAVNAAIKKE